MSRELIENDMRAQTENVAVDTVSVTKNLAIPTNRLSEKVLSRLIRVTQERAQESKQRDEYKGDTLCSSRCELQFGEQSKQVAKAAVKNTLNKACEDDEDGDESQPLVAWTKTAPGALLPKNFQCEQNQDQGDALVADAAESLASSKPTSVVLECNITTKTQIEADPSEEHSKISSGGKAAMNRSSEGHALVQCIPCAYFWHRSDALESSAEEWAMPDVEVISIRDSSGE
jgi:hypothetical protein